MISCKKKKNNNAILDLFLPKKLWDQLVHYLSFKLFLKIIRLVNESNALSLA